MTVTLSNFIPIARHSSFNPKAQDEIQDAEEHIDRTFRTIPTFLTLDYSESNLVDFMAHI